MSTAGHLLSRLRSLGIQVTARDGQLRVSAARGALTEEVKQTITLQKAELLELLLGAEHAEPIKLVRVPRGGGLPLSLFQQRLWVMHRLDPTSTTFNMVTVWLDMGMADEAALISAIQQVVARHEILRSTFRDDGGGPTVVPLAPEAVSVQCRDLGALSAADQKQAVAAEVAQATRQPFNLAVEAPVRWTVLRFSGNRVGLLVCSHHIVLDEWSFHLLQREILRVAAGTESEDAAGLQYADYAAYERRVHDPAGMAAELDWWERHLRDLPQLCSFPVDRAAPPDAKLGAFRPFGWSAELSEGIRSLAQQQGVTVYMVLLAACAAVLRVHTGQGDVVLGCPMGTRELPELETMLGPFINLLVLRLDAQDDPTFAELLARARTAVLEAHDHRHVPFEMIVERLNPVRNFDRSPLFQVAVVLHNSAERAGQLIYSGGSIHDLTWFAREVDGRLEGSIEYRSDLYEAASIDRIAAHTEALLRAAVQEPGQRISQISLLGEAERRGVVEQFNETAAALDPAPLTIQFERQAALRPAALAVRFQGQDLTYDELNRRANRLARYLRLAGGGRGAAIGVCLERSLEMVVALLAVQKAGAPYVPLDPRFPAERLSFMIADSGMKLLITAGASSASLEWPASVSVIDIDQQAAALEVLDPDNLDRGPGPGDVAYVMYTSGSTGRPNGVEITHGSLSNFLGSMQRCPGFASTDILAAVTTISFDIAGLELYLPLLVGGRVELVPREAAVDGFALAECLQASGATVLQATPETWRLLIEAGWQGGPEFRALCGGETLPRDLADEILDRVDELWNLYGPTETTIWSTVDRVERGSKSITVGRPIANTQVYVVDPAGRPAPIGVPGEIWIGGEGVAKGYRGRPELTAGRFIHDPFSGKVGARLYRTGDVGRWHADGKLVHLGRMDRQVKLRGFRLDPGEVEVALRAHPVVRHAVVVANNANANAPRLVAYVVFEAGADLTASEMRGHLRRSLPDYMIPSVFVGLDELPMTPNGKLDARSLPDPFRNAVQPARAFEPPATDTERLIAQIWADFLQVDQVGANDNFFELGGHSLLSLRVATAVEQQTGARLQPRALFFQSLRQVAASIAGQRV